MKIHDFLRDLFKNSDTSFTTENGIGQELPNLSISVDKMPMVVLIDNIDRLSKKLHMEIEGRNQQYEAHLKYSEPQRIGAGVQFNKDDLTFIDDENETKELELK